MSSASRQSDRQLRLSGLPVGSDSVDAGGQPFVAYCLGGEVRAEQRREVIRRARAAHRRAVQRGRDPYPTALVLAQRLGVALEDLARLLLAFESFGSSDPFAALRAGSLDRFDDVYSRLAGNPEALRSTIRLPHPEDTSELDAPLREAILEASDVLARRWHGHLGVSSRLSGSLG